MPTFRDCSTALIVVAMVELFGVALAAAVGGSVGVAGGLRADHAGLLFAFAAWPLLAVRAARRTGPAAVRLRHRR